MTDTRTLVTWSVLTALAVAVVVGGLIVAVAVATSQRGGTVVVLVGLSPSEQPMATSIDECARSAADQAIDDGATLSIVPIGRTPVELRTTPIRADAGLWDRMDPTGFEETKERLRADATDRIRQVRAAGAPTGGSDTIAAISIADGMLDDGGGPRTLIVCGDAHQVGAVNLYDAGGRTCEELLVAADPNISMLERVDVVFATPGADLPHSLPLPEERAIEHFWKTCWEPRVQPKSLVYEPAIK